MQMVKKPETTRMIPLTIQSKFNKNKVITPWIMATTARAMMPSLISNLSLALNSLEAVSIGKGVEVDSSVLIFTSIFFQF